MPYDYDDEPKCSLCGEPVTDRSWILMNRYAVGSGGHYSVEDYDDPEGWKIGRAEDEECQLAGDILCIETCLGAWLTGKLIEVDSA